jgi:Helix-turn-helix domain
MNGRGFITISMHELERVKIIEAVVQHRQTIILAAERLQLCERQVSRLVRRYEAAGPAGLVSAIAWAAQQPRTAGGCPCACDGAGA